MAKLVSGPVSMDWTGVYAGDRNEHTFAFRTPTDPPTPWDLTGATVTAQARAYAPDPIVAIEADCVITDPVGGIVTVTWDGEAVRGLLGGAEQWVGVWDLQLLEAGRELPETLVRGKWSAVHDVTREGRAAVGVWGSVPTWEDLPAAGAPPGSRYRVENGLGLCVAVWDGERWRVDPVSDTGKRFLVAISEVGAGVGIRGPGLQMATTVIIHRQGGLVTMHLIGAIVSDLVDEWALASPPGWILETESYSTPIPGFTPAAAATGSHTPDAEMSLWPWAVAGEMHLWANSGASRPVAGTYVNYAKPTFVGEPFAWPVGEPADYVPVGPPPANEEVAE